MKKLLLPLLLSSLFGFAASAATVSGIVTSAATCSPVSGQKVYLQDTMYNSVDSAVTTSAGVYTLTFPPSWPSPKAYIISISACGSVWRTAEHYHGISQHIDPIICGTPKFLNGTIMLGSTPNTGPARVYLVRVQRNFPTVGDTTLTAVDSVTLSTSPNYTFRRACTPSDTFLVKCALLPGHSAYSNWLPSYDSSLNWSSATRYYGSAFNGNPHYLFMFHGVNPGGPGFIGGSVLAGANKPAAVGDPLPARLMMLTNSTGAPVAYTYTNAAGQFSFSNIPVGTYKLFGDAWGMTNVPLTVVITAANPNVSNILFEEHYMEGSFKGKFLTTGVGSTTGPLSRVTVYPNPATSKVALDGLNGIRGSKTVTIRNIVGAIVSHGTFSDGQKIELDVEALSAGTYLLQLTTEAGAASFKLIK